MLVLDRRVKEGFWIGEGVFVKVLAVGRRRVKLGIEAPPDLAIVRDELRDRDRAAAAGNGNNRHMGIQRRDPSG